MEVQKIPENETLENLINLVNSTFDLIVDEINRLGSDTGAVEIESLSDDEKYHAIGGDILKKFSTLRLRMKPVANTTVGNRNFFIDENDELPYYKDNNGSLLPLT